MISCGVRNELIVGLENGVRSAHDGLSSLSRPAGRSIIGLEQWKNWMRKSTS